MPLMTMEALSERNVTIQMERNGILEPIIVKRCTQLELDEFIKSELARAERAQRAAPAPPLT